VGPTLSDERFHNTGVAWRDGRMQDDGRFEVTRKAEDRGAFKTPTLREIARTAPIDGAREESPRLVSRMPEWSLLIDRN
jgi:cytochrome c peroxidase